MNNFDFRGVAALCVEVVSAYSAVTIFCVDEAEEWCCLRYAYCIYLKYTVQLHTVHLLDSLINHEGGAVHSTKMSADLYKTARTWCHIPEDGTRK